MAESLINSIARLRVIEKRLLTREFIGRLSSAQSYEEALRMLAEAGYPLPAEGAEGDEIELMTRAKLEETYSLVEELMPQRYREVHEVFRMRHDLTNVKLLYKLRLLGAELDGARLDFGGVIDGEKLKEGVKRGDYSMLPRELKAALEELDVTTYHGADPMQVSCRIDSAFMEYACGVRNGFVRDYFGALADFTNVIAVIRKAPASAMLPGGCYSKELLAELAEALESSPERAAGLLKSPLETSALKERVRAAFEEYEKSGHTAAIERARDEYLMELASKNRSDIDSPAPIAAYLLAREREAEVIRLLLTAKRSGVPASAIEERSVAVYG